MQINTSVCDMTDDTFEYFNTCKSPIKWISTCLLTTSPNNDNPPWRNYKKTFRSSHITNTEYMINIETLKNTIKNAITVIQEKTSNKKINDCTIRDVIEWSIKNTTFNVKIETQEELFTLFTDGHQYQYAHHTL